MNAADAPCPRPPAGSHATLWLAWVGYATWRRVLALETEEAGVARLPATLEACPPEVQHAWESAAAAIRRRVVTGGLPAEEEEP